MLLDVHGLMNEEYKDMVSKFKAVLFLSTPHRGTDLADILNKVLSSSMFGHSPKDYVNELTKKSPTIDELNEQFRHHAAKLQIFSFYETLTTTVGPVKTLILEKHSSVLGYQHETPQPLVANHHDVCKFSSPEDPNYQSVKGALRSIVNSVRFSNDKTHENEEELSTLRKWLGVQGIPEDNLAAIRSDRIQGTCETLLQAPEFDNWLESGLQCPHLLWMNAPPGSGKTFQSSFVIDHIQSRKDKCVYWFFEYRDAQKRSLRKMLRSVAYQVAVQDPSYRQSLLQLQRTGTQVANGDANSLWRNLLGSRLSKCQSRIYMVVDALDEADSSKTFLDLFASLGSVKTNIQMLIVSRPLSSIRNCIQRLRKKAPDMVITEMALNNNKDDIRLAAIEEMEDFPGDDDFKDEVIAEVVSRSEGNFLWASLVLKKVLQCHRQEDVKRVLSGTPDGMDQLYERMVEAIVTLELEEDKTLSKILLSWAMYSTRPVSMCELRGPYSTELSSIIDLRHTVSHLCGGFATLDSENRITLVHQTAREYLKKASALPFSLTTSEVNEEILCQCLTSICDPSLKAKIRQGKTPSFLRYAAVSWHIHLERSSVHSERVLQILVKLFNDSALLTWIHYLAIDDNLPILVSVSSTLSSFVRKRRRADSIKPPMLHRIPELTLLEAWAVDLLKMTAKFGSYLIEDPEAIYKYIPSLSPHNSMLYKTHDSKSSSRVSISGLTSTDWDDCLARVSNGSDASLHVAVSAQHLAVANDSPNGSIRLFSNVIFQEVFSFNAGEPICSITFSQSGGLIACHGLDHTYVWMVEDGSLVAKVENPHQERGEALAFGPQEHFIVIATEMRRIYRLPLDGVEQSPSWTGLDPSLLVETSIPDGAFINSPSSLVFSPDCSQLAVAYKGFPLSIWNLDPPVMIGRCSVRRHIQRHAASSAWTGVNRVVWHPFNGQVLGIYRDGQIFKWGPTDDTHEEVKQELDATPSEITIAQNGLVFATSDVRGTIKIYDYAHMAPMYKLTSEDIIMAIAFSPDSKRFYDLRGSYCNVWEPSCLTRLVESGGPEQQDDSESVTSSEFRERRAESVMDLDDTRSGITSLAASEAHANYRPAITAVTTARDNQRIVLYAKDDGTVELCDTGLQKSHVLANSTYGMAVGQIVLSPKGNYAAYNLLNGKVIVKSIKISLKTGKLIAKEILSEKNDVCRGIVSQILFHSESRKLLVRGSSKIEVISFETEYVATVTEKILDIEPTESHISRWESHPTDPNTLLAFTASRTEAYSWDDLTKPRYATPINLFAHDGRLTSVLPDAPGIAVELVVPSPQGKAHLAIVSFEEANNKVFSFVLLDTSPLHQGKSAAADTVLPIDLPEGIAEKIEQPVGFLEDGRFVFLDESLWVCTTKLRAGASDGVKRHFFIPRDWINSAGLGMCRVQPDGTFLCPSKGELAVVRGDLGMDWGGI